MKSEGDGVSWRLVDVNPSSDALCDSSLSVGSERPDALKWMRQAWRSDTVLR